MAVAWSNLLLDWYRSNHRKLPWRRTRDPYKIWVSEIMLQQTQVQTVLEYYKRWLRTFPTLSSLARAPQHRVLKAWQGLGYYSRARNLHKAAIAIVKNHRGIFPSQLEAIRKLPGVGPYTAGAIASIAFNAPEPALDVNVLRVAARLLLIREDISKASVRQAIAAQVSQWIPKGKARWFNQALMELGALICLPKAPRCLVCPIREHCAAARQGAQEEIPAKAARAQRKSLRVVAGILQDPQGRVLIQQRPDRGLMANLWEFPGGKVRPGESFAAALRREWKEELGVTVQPQRQVLLIRHAYTQFDVRLHVWTCSLMKGSPKPLWAQAIRWVPLEELDHYPYPSANARIVRWLQECRPALTNPNYRCTM